LNDGVTDLAAAHARLRPLMFSIAYRMLGSVTEAEDVVQEALLRMHTAAEPIQSPEAYAVTVTTRLAIDQLRSARARREEYVGTWLPEPLVASAAEPDPATVAAQAADVSFAFLVLLERLSPVERAVFLLREVFGYGYDEVAAIVGKTEANCRQLLRRARHRLQQDTPRYQPSPAHRDELVDRFLAACTNGDLEALERTLADHVTFYADGGGKAAAVTHPVHGRTQVARFILGLVRHARRHHQRIEPVSVNGEPGARLVDDAGRVLAVLALDMQDGAVRALYNVVNPDKLAHLSRAAF
jgi:RNA polymerase sigma-70 factor (TIGR02957 family)